MPPTAASRTAAAAALSTAGQPSMLRAGCAANAQQMRDALSWAARACGLTQARCTAARAAGVAAHSVLDFTPPVPGTPVHVCAFDEYASAVVNERARELAATSQARQTKRGARVSTQLSACPVSHTHRTRTWRSTATASTAAASQTCRRRRTMLFRSPSGAQRKKQQLPRACRLQPGWKRPQRCHRTARLTPSHVLLAAATAAQLSHAPARAESHLSFSWAHRRCQTRRRSFFRSASFRLLRRRLRALSPCADP